MSSTTTFEPALDVKTIRPHPANPRHTARADVEMVDSIKSQGLIQPLVVAPATDGNGYVVIAGHRRLDGLKKAKKSAAPAVVRQDLTTDAQQIEAAVVENVHRVDLTPLEEAEAFAQLRDLKWSQPKIAERTGRPITTVRERLKLLTLSKRTQSSVHKGQLTIGDALAIASFDDDAQARLAKVAGKPEFRHALETERSRRKHQVQMAELLAKLDSVPEIELQDGETRWNNPYHSLGESLYAGRTYDLQKLLAGLRKTHKKCLARITEQPSHYYSGRVDLYCSAPASHGDLESQEATARERERNEAIRQRQERNEALATARAVRVATVMDLVGAGTRLDSRFVDVARVLLPTLLETFDPSRFETYAKALGIWQDDKPWFTRLGYGGLTSQSAQQSKDIFLEHVAEIRSATAGELARRLIAALLAVVEDKTVSVQGNLYNHPFADRFTVHYYDLLESLGLDRSDIDNEILDTAKGRLADIEDDDDAAIDPYVFMHARGSKPGDPISETPCGLRVISGKTLKTTAQVDNIDCPTCVEISEEQDEAAS